MNLQADRAHAWRCIITEDQILTEQQARQSVQNYLESHPNPLPEPAEKLGDFHSDGFSSWSLPKDARLLRTSCCPDKDIVAIVIRHGLKDRLSLWEFQGLKRWEVDMEKCISTPEDITALAWSPDGDSLLVSHHPPSFSLISLHDGSTLMSIPATSADSDASRLENIWWWKDNSAPQPDFFSDISKPGSRTPAYIPSILSSVPLLDQIRPDIQSASINKQFNFKGPDKELPAKRLEEFPEIYRWPSLYHRRGMNRFGPTLASGKTECQSTGEHDVTSEYITRSLAVATDTSGTLQFLLDGTYNAGFVASGVIPVTALPVDKLEASSLFLHGNAPKVKEASLLFHPLLLRLPLFNVDASRQIAEVSTSLRELVWHCVNVLGEMQASWFGTEDEPGAAALGAKWLQSLELAQKTDWGYREQRGVVDLTLLLITGQASQPVATIMGGGENMSERRLTKWETTVNEALQKIRDGAEKRLHPSLQRIHILLEVVQSWSSLPQTWGTYELPTLQVSRLLEHVSTGLYLTSWLAKRAREEMDSFKEFILWLRYESQRAQSNSAETSNNLTPTHDPLQVNKYLISGLGDSEIDGWFEGPVPDKSVQQKFETSLPDLKETLRETKQLAEMRLFRDEFKASHNSSHEMLSKNLEALMKVIASEASDLFTTAAASTVKVADIQCEGQTRISPFALDMNRKELQGAIIRSRMKPEKDSANSMIMFDIVAYVPSTTGVNLLCCLKLSYGKGTTHMYSRDSHIAVATCVPRFMNAAVHRYEVLDFEFLHDGYLVIVFRHTHREVKSGSYAFIGLSPFGFGPLRYQPLRADDRMSNWTTAEEAVLWALELTKHGQIEAEALVFDRLHELKNLARSGMCKLSLDGKRRVGCVVDEQGVIEMLDFSAESEEFPVSR